ncbi:hypothetical protein ACO0QE_000095 [Hanseniaspora vineae]
MRWDHAALKKRKLLRNPPIHITNASTMAKIKFGDDDAPAAPLAEIQPPAVTQATNNVIDTSSDDDDDEAPEEEAVADSAQQIQKLEKQQQDAIAQKENELKAKRRAKSLKFQEQQKLKNERLQFEKEKLLEFEKQLKLKESENEKDTPTDAILNEQAMEELPEDFLASLNSETVNGKTATPNHHKFDEDLENEAFDSANDDYFESSQQIRKAKQNTLKNLRKMEVKKGSFIISRKPATQSRSVAPKVEKKVMSVRDKWLKRKALNKK